MLYLANVVSRPRCSPCPHLVLPLAFFAGRRWWRALHSVGCLNQRFQRSYEEPPIAIESRRISNWRVASIPRFQEPKRRAKVYLA